MGILGLKKLIANVAPHAINQCKIGDYTGFKVAIDISTSLHQFLYASSAQATTVSYLNEGSKAHLNGTFYRTIRMVHNKILPIYVFDGKAPDMKLKEIQKRGQRRVELQTSLQKAIEDGNEQEVIKLNSRLVNVHDYHINDCKALLELMGIPYVQAPCEAEAQCAHLVKTGKADAVGAEDMDTLAFGCKLLLRDFVTSESRKIPVKAFQLKTILDAFQMNEDQFIDLCILLGCDYCETIYGIGPKRGIKLVQEHKSIERILEVIDKKKYIVPENWAYQGARSQFKNPKVVDVDDVRLHQANPDFDGLLSFMVNENGFSETSILSALEKLHTTSHNTKKQHVM